MLCAGRITVLMDLHLLVAGEPHYLLVRKRKETSNGYSHYAEKVGRLPADRP